MLGLGPGAAAYSGVRYQRLQAIAAGGKPTRSEAVLLHYGARDAGRFVDVRESLAHSGKSKAEQQRVLRNYRRVVRRGHVDDKQRLFRGVRLSNRAYETIFGRLR